MSDVQVSLLPLPVADARTVPAMPMPEGDSGFQLLDLQIEGVLPQVDAANLSDLPIAVPAPPEDNPDPLAAWLEGSLGLSAHFSPAAAAPDPALPDLPADLPPPTANAAAPDLMPEAEDVLLPLANDDARSDTGVPADEVASARVNLPDLAQAAQADDSAAAATGEAAGYPQEKIDTLAIPARQGMVPDNKPITQSHPARQAVQITVGAKPAEEDAQPSTVGLRESPGREADAAPKPAPTAKDGDVRQVATPSVQARDSMLTVEAGPLDQVSVDASAPVLTQRGTVAATALSPSVTPQDPRPVLQQVAEAIVSTRGDRTEIALSPEELGRVRLIMTGPDRAQITVWAERPETLDLVRRNADLLTQHLAEAGVDTGSLNFRQDSGRNWQEAGDRRGRDDEDPFAAPAAVVRMSPTTLSDRRLDIRL